MGRSSPNNTLVKEMIRSSTRSHIWLSILAFLQLFTSRRISPLANASKLSIWGIERFSYDLELKTREQNRNNKQKEIERFDWFIERIQKCAWLLAG